MNRNHPNHLHQPPDPEREADSRHTPHLDTVAQKPTHIGLGAPVTDPEENAHRDHDEPTPGAQPPFEKKEPELREREHVAAGLIAMSESAKFTLRPDGSGQRACRRG